MVEIEGYRQLQQTIDQLGKIPQTIVTKAARKGARVVLPEAKKKAPVEIGNLKRGIILRPEKTTTKGKKVFQVVMDRAFNRFFVKESKDGKRAYYPASQEYGFFSRGPNGSRGKYIPGYNYLRGANASKHNKAQQIIIRTMLSEVDKYL
ncbi:HK97 gp10 family phage protein [Bacillus sp. UNCCL81]|uniref:HK97 gp10 family phage protein n=1 Tax=Bacillus sp. UNCCL81 TaxID=1502755 RepID=UPI0008E118A3|nr:HK97 gp10 family phage protein [Bacillus sp. UNCCL81]SFD44098.1 Bacteriophage HK97-gp10, putative tail-component [Bacillus sp. UNCCL81]